MCKVDEMILYVLVLIGSTGCDMGRPVGRLTGRVSGGVTAAEVDEVDEVDEVVVGAPRFTSVDEATPVSDSTSLRDGCDIPGGSMGGVTVLEWPGIPTPGIEGGVNPA